ncbi:uncharacterized protein LOC110022472 [Phalaenopsis equestris]|uniref:uncharacterized protein LOC110022472 n=1 Tax=Phalaenopsis equestris TaxID=78828 RepID=UPI0009E3215E|nr:uncharacterized protein LOC110022472 [Phalaenopsis equestris]
MNSSLEKFIMATEGPKALATFFLFINLLMYAILVVVAGWALNYGIDETPQSVSELSLPARLFPVYYPIGNLATGFVVMFSLIAGLVGVAASLTGLQNVVQGSTSGLLSAAASSVMAWGLTLLAMGLACKEISIGWRTAGLRALETLTIMASGTQLLCTGAIHAALPSTISQPLFTGRA